MRKTRVSLGGSRTPCTGKTSQTICGKTDKLSFQAQGSAHTLLLDGCCRGLVLLVWPLGVRDWVGGIVSVVHHSLWLTGGLSVCTGWQNTSGEVHKMRCLRLYWDTVVLLTGRVSQGLVAPGMEAAMTAGIEHQVWGPNWPGQGAPANPAQVLSLAVRRPHRACYFSWHGLGWPSPGNKHRGEIKRKYLLRTSNNFQRPDSLHSYFKIIYLPGHSPAKI